MRLYFSHSFFPLFRSFELFSLKLKVLGGFCKNYFGGRRFFQTIGKEWITLYFLKETWEAHERNVRGFKFFSLSLLQTSWISETSSYQERFLFLFFFFLRFSVAGKFLTLERHPGSSLSSRSYSEALHCHWPLPEKPDPLCFAQSLLEFLRTGAGGEDSSPSRCTDLQA